MAPSRLEIRVKALVRLLKDEKLYHQELAEQQAVVDAMKARGADEYDLKKQIEVLEDTRQMIPALRGKVQEALREVEEDRSVGEEAAAAVAAAKALLAGP